MTVETFTIYPTKKYNRPPPPTTIAFHGLDYCPPIQIRNHRIFHRPTSSTSDVIDRLKSSLAEALELYPPISGTLKTNENGDWVILMDAANILGTPFLVEIKDTPYAGDTVDLAPRSEDILAPSSSIFAVKFTQFSCGTIAVASSFNHQLADLSGFLDFLELWAQIARGETVDFTKIPGDWSRNPGQYFSGLISETTAPTTPPPFRVLPTPATGAPACYLAPSVITRWNFTKSSMERLKNDFSPSGSKDMWISSGDALAALICGAITRARYSANVPRLDGRSSLESETEEIAMAADGRERAPQGNMTGQYFGNFNPLWSAVVSRSDLSSLTNESASRVALSIRNNLNLQLSPEAIANKISFFEYPQNLKPPGRISYSADIILTNWCKFDLGGPKLDFGWGIPFQSTAGSGGVLPPGYSVMTQDKRSGDVSVLMTIEQEGADHLKADSVLNKYATLAQEHQN
ncbi:hypothetical protein BGZ76_005410 [Entomortierella beljakovae]|nr:hypothetical protein BGZ76_005410 [Entomortierella beljakovae]